MRRLLVAVVAASFALSPLALFGVTSGMQAAHADLGWCDECDIVRTISGVAPTTQPVPVVPVAPVTGGRH